MWGLSLRGPKKNTENCMAYPLYPRGFISEPKPCPPPPPHLLGLDWPRPFPLWISLWIPSGLLQSFVPKVSCGLTVSPALVFILNKALFVYHYRCLIWRCFWEGPSGLGSTGLRFSQAFQNVMPHIETMKFHQNHWFLTVQCTWTAPMKRWLTFRGTKHFIV
jgi:hypothetical protein